MALDFPANPTNGQTFGSYIYDTSIPGWRNVNSSEGIGLQFKAGMVPLVPSTITLSGGSASTSADGRITLTNATDVNINGIFSSAYKNYKIIFSADSQMANPVQVRYVQGNNSPDASAGYLYANMYVQGGSSGVSYAATTAQTIGTHNFAQDFNLDIYRPFDARTTHSWFNSVYNFTHLWGELTFTGATSFTGIQFLNNTMTATVQVYGYK